MGTSDVTDDDYLGCDYCDRKSHRSDECMDAGREDNVEPRDEDGS